MPRSNYGNAVKQRAAQFFSVLLDYANDELDGDERQLENLQRDIQLNWQTDKRCAIRTKVRYLERLVQLAGIELSSEQIKESIKCLTDFIEIIEDNRTSKGGSETWHFTLILWYDRFDRSANIHKFDTEWDRRKSLQNLADAGMTTARTDEWRELVKSSLTAQHYYRITTNPLMVEDRIKFSLAEVYVPLGLMERSPEPIFEVRDRIDDGGEEIGQNIVRDPDRLLARLVTNTEPNRIGIIGEPGSGKTTCLQKLAAGLLDRQLLPIWISLADLQGESLENYLLQDWLKLATKMIAIDPKMQQDLVNQFQTGRVWLLLDAIDEMAIDPSIALGNLARQLQGWIGAAHIIVTCRSNVWDSGKNVLENFTTYRNLGLDRGYNRSVDRIHQFMQGWFKDRPDLSEKLLLELDRPQYQQLRDAIKNPLRLALLCRYWLRTQGKLPSTKASLYQQFTDTIYDWKQDRFTTSLAQRQQLNDALGKLAFQAITSSPDVDKNTDRWRSLSERESNQKQHVRFRLHHHNVLTCLTPELLELALQLGWLNQTGISIATGSRIYAFYHSTFQEYFAARSITDWHYFFTGDLNRQLPIFSPDWQETILFWFGRGDISHLDKEACIEALINFDKNCGGCYYYRAYFLAAAALAEFPESSRATNIIDRLLAWRFAEFIPDLTIWQFYPLPIQDGARLALRQADRIAAIAGLEKFIQAIENPFLKWQAAHSLGKVFDPGNSIAIQALATAIASVYNGDLCIKMCESLFKIDSEYNQAAIAKLVDIIGTNKTISLTRKAAFTLGKLLLDSISVTNENRELFDLAINTIVAIIESPLTTKTAERDLQNERVAALENLRQIYPAHPVSQIELTSKQTLPSSTRNRHKKIARQYGSDIAIAELESKLITINNAETQRRYAYQLGKFQPGHRLAVNTLLQLISSAQPSSFYKRTGEYLKEVLVDEQLPLVVMTLKDLVTGIELGDRSPLALECYKILWYCADRLPYRKFVEIWDEDNQP
ncbi:NACHT domain-containing protein [Chamaesiphon sp. GL140_3_metabinner_50]|uniref:NACHT domain-containing protein n=1 Tax=Chamaesiphon sp. GL140_3_metabinner_50 TaxID=2970812 RepID=UPI0025DF7BB7|nr:NACHT domain-containing protein [Chamaesiphon sp. GL140_3_metabinner_50]